MIWPQQYHKEKQGSDGRAADFKFCGELLRKGWTGEAYDEFWCQLPKGHEGPHHVGRTWPAISQPVEAPGEQPNSLAQQRVLDVSPESPTDATRGVGEQWRVEQFETGASMITGEMQYGLTDGSYHLFLGTLREEMAEQHARYLNATRGDGDDPIPQRECEHEWEWRRSPSCDRFICAHCAAIKLAPDGVIYLPQPIDPRSEAR